MKAPPHFITEIHGAEVVQDVLLTLNPCIGVWTVKQTSDGDCHRETITDAEAATLIGTQRLVGASHANFRRFKIYRTIAQWNILEQLYEGHTPPWIYN